MNDEQRPSGQPGAGQWAEEALRKSEALYRLLADSMVDTVWLMDMNLKTTYSSPSSQKLRGYTLEEVQQLPLDQQLTPASLQAAMAAFLEEMPKVMADPTYNFSRILQLEFYKKDGSVFWSENTFSLIRDENGNPASILCEGRDITDRKQAEEALRESEDRYRTLLENVGEGIGFVNPEEQFGFTNAASEDIFGVPSNGLQGRSLHEFANSEQFGLIREQTKRRRAGEKSVYEIEISRPNGEKRDLLVTAVPQFDSQGKFVGALGVFRDITDRKRLEQEMAKARADFLFAVSHELKTPLFLMASAQELLETLPSEQRAERFLEYGEIWKRNLHRLRHLVENLVDSQRSEGMGLKITPVPTDLVEILQQTLKDVDFLTLQQRLRFHKQLDSLPSILADPESIHRLFENLLTNAIKFSPPDGEVEISLALQGEEALFRVRDFGAGIPPEEIPQLFQPFQRTTGANQAVIPGTGLGLYTAKLIVEAHGGSIALHSELGKGTTIVVRLPLNSGITGT